MVFYLALEEVAIKDRNHKSNYKKNNNNNNYKNNKNNNGFNNFQGRNYDYNSLEKKLLGWDKND